MYKSFSVLKYPESSRFFIGGKVAGDIGPAKAGDKVSVYANKNGDTKFIILIEKREKNEIKGVILRIEPEPKNEYNDWCVGHKIKIKGNATCSVDGMCICVWRAD